MREIRPSGLMRGGSWLTHLGQLLPTLSPFAIPKPDPVFWSCRGTSELGDEISPQLRSDTKAPLTLRQFVDLDYAVAGAAISARYLNAVCANRQR